MDKDKLRQFGIGMLQKGYSMDQVKKFIMRRVALGNRATIQPTSQSTSQGGNQMDLIKKYFPQEEWQRAYNVMMGESGGRSDAVGDDYPINGVYAPSYGLFQIRGLPGRPKKEQLFDPEFNTKYAADMWRGQGWKPWHNTARKLGYL